MHVHVSLCLSLYLRIGVLSIHGLLDLLTNIYSVSPTSHFLPPVSLTRILDPMPLLLFPPDLGGVSRFPEAG